MKHNIHKLFNHLMIKLKEGHTLKIPLRQTINGKSTFSYYTSSFEKRVYKSFC